MDEEVKGVKYIVIEGDYTLDGECTVGYTDAVLYSCTSEMYMLLTNYPNKVNLKK